MAQPDPVYTASVYRLTAANFRASAEILAASFDSELDDSPKKLTCIPFYFLISHAAELFLKSALLKRGFPERDLRKFDFRHSLNTLLAELQGKGVLVSAETVSMIDGLHTQHKEHALRYSALIDDGKATFLPPPAQTFKMLDELLLLTRVSTQGV